MKASRLGLLAVLLCLPGSLSGQGGVSLEYRVKAAYLVNFARYITWSESDEPAPGDPLSICVLGEDPFGTVLDSLTRGRQIDGHPLAARRVRTVAEAGDCQLVFLSHSEWTRRPELLNELSRPGVVTIGESEAFGRAGGVISFVISNETVRFTVNLAARDRAGVRISSRVLSLATMVFGPEERR